MKILLVEWMTGGGLLVQNQAPNQSCPFQSQGQDMLANLVADLHHANRYSATGYELIVPVDHRLVSNWEALLQPGELVSISQPNLQIEIARLANIADRILVIAPESEVLFDGVMKPCLDECLRWIDPVKKRLVSPCLEFVRLAACKTETCSRLAQSGISTPRGKRLSEFHSMEHAFDFFNGLPFVLKPNRDAGSHGVCLVDPGCPNGYTWPKRPADWRAEEYCKGTPASVAVLCRNAHRSHVANSNSEPSHELALSAQVHTSSRASRFQCLPPMIQVLESPLGHFSHAYPVTDPNQVDAISQLAVAVLLALPNCRGFVGIDLIIQPNGQLVVVEVNPRLTASYSAVSEVCDFNVAHVMMQL